MEQEKTKKITEMIAELPGWAQDLAANYIKGLVDGRKIREAAEKEEEKENRDPQ